MNFLHYDINAGSGNAVRVTLDKQANVVLLDDSNFHRYKNGGPFQYYGGLAKQSPIVLRIPYSGHWNVVVDLGGLPGTVNVSVEVI